MRHRGEILMPFHLVHTLLASKQVAVKKLRRGLAHCIFSGSLHHNFHHLVFPSAFTSLTPPSHASLLFLLSIINQVRLYLQELSSSLVSIIAAERYTNTNNKNETEQRCPDSGSRYIRFIIHLLIPITTWSNQTQQCGFGESDIVASVQTQGG